ARGWLAEADRAEQAGMVVPVGGGELERKVVLGVEMAAAGKVAAHQGAGAGADDELVGRVVAATLEDLVVHGAEDVALEGAGAPDLDGLAAGGIGQLVVAAHAGELGGALDEADAGDEVGGVLERGEAGQRRLQPLAVAGGQAIG